MSEQFYSSTNGAKLYMGAATSIPLPVPGADVFTEVPLLITASPPPKEIGVGGFNVQNDTNRRSVGGKKSDQICEGSLVIDWSEPVHVSMAADPDVSGGQKRNWRLVYPDGGNRTLDFVGFLNKWTEEPFDADQEAKEHRAAFSIAVSGAITTTA
jgi:hypothetical protein